MTPEFDVIISGAGPAGCTAALALGPSGLRIAIIEKERFPREKICGDGIPAYVPKVLDSINTEYKKAFEALPGKVEVDICRVISPANRILDLKFSECGYICKRSVFDSFLFGLVNRLSNITVFQETRVQDVVIGDHVVSVTTDKEGILKAKIIIGCDGATSITRRKLTNRGIDPRHCSSAVRAYFRDVEDIPPQTLELHFVRELLPGYLWIFPMQDNVSNVGLGIPSAVVAKKKISLKKLLPAIIENNPILRDRFKNAEMIGETWSYILPLGSRRASISGNRFMLCGDAASLINPASGAGIGQAMQSGRYAGWHAA
ncbi:MAG: geranylgeranyl reductase family protein, partial [Bacteroidota bacterium]|nr:geranylgeranyl reductase family protein [Bacteroidota bacterium]